MNEKKICFIMCVNDDRYEEECLRYIRQLHVPEGFEVEQLSVRDAACMTAGYNEAMEASDAKYKVYLHQDVFIVNKDFIPEILRIFEDPAIGMIGMAGSPKMPADAVMWSGERTGRIFTSNVKESVEVCVGSLQKPYREVEAIDGLLMATQADIRWRDDLFLGWDFYDVSQSMEFRKKGFRIVVPYVERGWVLHDDGFVNLSTYFDWRDVFLKEYGDMIDEGNTKDRIVDR